MFARKNNKKYHKKVKKSILEIINKLLEYEENAEYSFESCLSLESEIRNTKIFIKKPGKERVSLSINQNMGLK